MRLVKELVVKLGSPEEANKMPIGDVWVSTVDRGAGEFTIRITNPASRLFNHPSATPLELPDEEPE